MTCFDRKLSNKTMLLSSKIRTNLALMKKSRKITSEYYKKTLEQSIHYLAQSSLIYPPLMVLAGLHEDMSYQERKMVLGLGHGSTPDEDRNTIEFKELLAVQAKKNIRTNWIWRIGEECAQKSIEGWYGFFVTLTVDPSRVADSEKMWKEGVELRKYLKRLAKVSAAACGMPRAIHDGASTRDFVQHVGAIEHGKSRHHHHMHMLIWMRDIPDSWKVCPNRGVKDPRHRTNDWCRPMTTYWPNSLPGIGRAKYFRHEGDIWSRHGFALPWDAKKNRVVRIHVPEKAGLYIAKYMDKEDKVWTHRIKATRNLGMNRLKTVLMGMHYSKVEALTWRPRSYSMSILATTIHTVPPALLRSVAKQEHFYRMLANNTLDWDKHLQENSDSFKAMLKSVQDGARPKRMPSKDLYDWVTQHLPVPDGYCEKRLKRAYVSLGVNFNPCNYQTNSHIGIT